MDAKYRNLRGEELLSLRGKWVICKETEVLLPIEGIDHVDNLVKIRDTWRHPSVLYRYYTYEDGSLIGAKIELSSDGYTLEEFLAKANDDCSNVECAYTEQVFPCRNKTVWKKPTKVYRGNLKSCRIKPTQYIRPKVGFRGSVMCEVGIELSMNGLIKKEIIGVDLCSGEPRYRSMNGDSTICRLLPFSADNPPPTGTKFRIVDWDEDSFARYASPTEDNWFSSEKDGDYTWNDDIIWIDFEDWKSE